MNGLRLGLLRARRPGLYDRFLFPGMIHRRSANSAVCKGLKPIALDGEVGFFSRADTLIMMRLSDLHPLDSIKIPLSKLSTHLSRSRLLTRMLRLGVQVGAVWRDTLIVAAEGRLISVQKSVDSLTGVRHEADISRGRSPLHFGVVNGIDGFDDGVYYGEYFSNSDFGPVAIMRRGEDGQWTRAYEFPVGEINHVHNIVPDPLRDCVWILTGDFGQGAAIWQARDNFASMVPVVRGAQQVRACVAFPVRQGLLYATDSQLYENSIRVLERDGSGWTHRQLHPLNGPSIHGTTIGELCVFSTATEPDHSSVESSRLIGLMDRRPGPGIIRNESHIIVGSIERGFSTKIKRVKDPLPYRLFQFGNILFPSGSAAGNSLFLYSIANRGVSMSTEILNL